MVSVARPQQQLVPGCVLQRDDCLYRGIAFQLACKVRHRSSFYVTCGGMHRVRAPLLRWRLVRNKDLNEGRGPLFKPSTPEMNDGEDGSMRAARASPPSWSWLGS